MRYLILVLVIFISGCGLTVRDVTEPIEGYLDNIAEEVREIPVEEIASINNYLEDIL